MTDEKKEWVFLDRDDEELLRVWRTFSDPVEIHPASLEVWQYMGTIKDERGRWLHCWFPPFARGDRRGVGSPLSFIGFILMEDGETTPSNSPSRWGEPFATATTRRRISRSCGGFRHVTIGRRRLEIPSEISSGAKRLRVKPMICLLRYNTRHTRQESQHARQNTTTDNRREKMTVEEYAKAHDLSIETVRRYIRCGKLKAEKQGRSYLISDTDTTANDNTHDTIDDKEAALAQQLLADKEAKIAQLEASLTAAQHRLERLEDELSDSRQRSDSIIMQLSVTVEKQQSQIQSQTLQIEDLRQQPKSFWERIFYRRKLAAG